MTPREALDRIARLCDLADAQQPGRLPAVLTSELRAVLAEVTPEPGGVLDRDQARDLIYAVRDGFAPAEDALDALAGCVRPAAIDRDAFERLVIEARYSRGVRWTTERLVDAIVALVRPVAGVTLTPEEAATVRSWYRGDRATENPDERALAARLADPS